MPTFITRLSCQPRRQPFLTCSGALFQKNKVYLPFDYNLRNNVILILQCSSKKSIGKSSQGKPLVTAAKGSTTCLPQIQE